MKAGTGGLLELGLVVLTGVGHVVVELTTGGAGEDGGELSQPQHLYNLGACVAWAIYLVWRAVRDPGILREWGFRAGGLRASLVPSAGFAIAAVGFLAALGVWRGHWPLPRTFWLLFVLYPLWGVAQQFVLQALITRNLRGLVEKAVPRALAASLVFSAAHFPNYALMVLTLPAGIAFALIYERYGNLWVVGVTHGLLGALAYYLVLGEDLGAELLQLAGGH